MRYILLILTILISATNSYAQRDQLGCMDKSIRVQAEQFKRDFKAQGLEVFKDAMITMTPKEPTAVAVQLNAGQLYQLVYIGSNKASKIYFELFDGQDNKIAEKKLDKPTDNNFLVYSFIPQKSDVYLLVLTQKIKGNKNVCGSFTIMQKPTQQADGSE